MCNVVPANGGVLSMEYELISFVLSQTDHVLEIKQDNFQI